MRMLSLLVICGVSVTGLVAGCSAARVRDSGRLNSGSALELAVDLANAECEKQYATQPFEKDSYSVAFLGDRWHWGEIDPAGRRGYSATVSFDAFGEERRVEVAFHVDNALYE